MSKDIRPMTDEERKRSEERERINAGENPNRCVSCDNPAKDDFCDFCLNEE